MCKIEMDGDYKNVLCKKVHDTFAEFGDAALEHAFIVGFFDEQHISDIPYYKCPTLTQEKLGGVSYKVARFFEDI